MSVSNPRVSVVTIVFNDIQNIEKTILSVVNQTYPHIDYILIDGGSTDGTTEIIKKYASSISYRVSEKDKGIYDAMNKGQQAATGDYLIFMNSGDLFADHDVLYRIFNGKTKYADVYYGETYLIDKSGTILGTRTDLTTRKLPANMTWKDMKKGMVVCHQSFLVKRELAPRYNLAYKCSADIDWVIQSLKNASQIVNTNIVISKYLVGGYSIANQRRCWEERFAIYKNHYGLLATIWTHIGIILKNIPYKITGRKNY
jgi:glycosyltransferase involved in cell wall biosynthesis